MAKRESESQVGQPQKEPLRHLEVRQQNPLPDPCSKSGLQRAPGNTLAPAGCTAVPAILQEGDPAVVISREFPLGSPALLRASQFTDRLLRPRELRHLAKVTIHDPDLILKLSGLLAPTLAVRPGIVRSYCENPLKER